MLKLISCKLSCILKFYNPCSRNYAAFYPYDFIGWDTCSVLDTCSFFSTLVLEVANFVKKQKQIYWDLERDVPLGS